MRRWSSFASGRWSVIHNNFRFVQYKGRQAFASDS
jgi:hypothetical protein